MIRYKLILQFFHYRIIYYIMNMLTLTKEPIFYGFIGALISIIITYIDTKIFKDNKDKITYCKVKYNNGTVKERKAT